MCLKILLKELRKFKFLMEKEIHDYSIIILPIVNLDSHNFISESYGKN